MMETQDRPSDFWDTVGSLLRNKRPIMVIELATVLLLPALWGFLPLPRTILPVVVLAWASLWLRGLAWRDVGLRRPRRWAVALLAGVAAGGLIVFSATVILPNAMALAGEAYEPSGLSALRGNLPLVLMLLGGTWILAALMEEMVFRGYLLNRLADLFGHSRYGWGAALVLSALLFSWSHGVYEVWFLTSTFLHGLLMGGLYMIGGRNLWFSVIAHGSGISLNLVLAFLGLV